MEKNKKCGEKCEVFSRIVGYYRPIQDWNIGKKHEFERRKNFKINSHPEQEAETSEQELSSDK